MKRTLLFSLGALALLTTSMAVADVRDGLVAYWPLDKFDDDGAGTFIDTPDLVAGHHMVVRNFTSTDSLITGKYGKAIQFDGASQYCFFTAPTNVDMGLPISRNPSFTVSLWVKGLGTTAGDKRYFCESSVTNGDNNPLFGFGSQQYGTNYSTRIYIRNPGTVLVDYQNSTNATLDGNWHHVGIVYDVGAFRFYVDGKRDYTNRYTQGTSIYDTTAIGAVVRTSIAAYYTGAVDELAVWSRALTQDELMNVMTNGIQTPIPQTKPMFNNSPVGASNLVPADNWTMTASVYGTRPMTYQWAKNGSPIAGATMTSLALTNMTTADGGDYTLVVANAMGSATSGVATLTFATFPPANLTNGIISYWPLDTVLGTKTADLVSGYDMNLVKLGATNLVDGRYGKCFQFDNATQTMLQRANNPGEDLPIYNKPNFTVAFWVAGSPQSDHRLFAEGNTTNNTPLFDIGTHNTGADGTIDSYIRSDAGATVGDHRHTTGIAFDGNWHHITYVQRDLGSGGMMGTFYIDGLRDPLVVTPVRPLTATTTAIGGLLRGSASAWYTGLIDEVVVWNRALSDTEITLLQSTTITNPPSRLQPLAINSFKAELPTVANGGSTILHWDVSKDATQVLIDKVGDVTSKTSVGIGTNAITLTNTTTYTLTVKRGVDTVSASTTVTVISGVAAGWTLLDNFDTYALGQLTGTGYWTDPHGNAAQIIDLNGNRTLKPVTSDSDVFLNLQSLTVKEQEICTLFFRIIFTNDAFSSCTNLVGLTDKSQRGYADEYYNIGPVLYFNNFTNEAVDLTTNAWFMGARDWPGSSVQYPGQPLQTNTVYNVWVNITNAPMSDPSPYDLFWVYVQKEGDSTRTLVFDGFTSDRDATVVDPVLGSMTPNLDKVVVLGNNATYTALFDDFYLSKGAYNATVPRPYGFTGPVGPLPALQILWSGTQLQILWTTGTLQEAPAISGPWTDVSGAAPPSYVVSPTGSGKFYRARQ